MRKWREYENEGRQSPPMKLNAINVDISEMIRGNDDVLH